MLVTHASVMINYMIFPQKLIVLSQVTIEIISIDKTVLLNLSVEIIVYISSKLIVNMDNTFRKCLKRGA